MSQTGSDYRGRPYADEKWPGGPQKIPGRVLCACYDTGGEGVAYHDSDPENHGSGELNPVNGSYLHSFRINEGVDTSYVKYHDEIDNSPFNRVQPEKDLLYVGWTVPGEWLKYTVQVEADGLYSVTILYTSRRGGKITLDAENGETLVCTIESTYDAADPVEWRQWHHWNRQHVGEISLSAGIHVLTLKTAEEGNMNYACLEFKLKEGSLRQAAPCLAASRTG
ncbi:MAG: carbohydrate-binding protein [Treponema sp.]|jgi:hypothetical protein|nr:carbohydrate-binding protein [Treponema sp.]